MRARVSDHAGSNAARDGAAVPALGCRCLPVLWFPRRRRCGGGPPGAFGISRPPPCKLTGAAAIRRVFEEEGELSAIIEVRRRFAGITDSAKARECARTIAGWTPLPGGPAPVTRLRPGRS